MAKDKQSRKWQLTINNPQQWDLTHEVIKDILSQIKPIVYYCMSDEIGLKDGTHHTHLFIACSSPMRFSTLKNKFPKAHIEFAKGTSSQNRDYIFKIGKWTNDIKNETNLPDTHEECGELPLERQGKRSDLQDLYDLIESGLSDYEILQQDTEHMLNLEMINKTRQIINREIYKNTFRQLEVTYIYGKTGVGKSRMVMEKYGYSNVFRVTNYIRGGFDAYHNQDVILFEEFRSSIPIQDMLNYLDGYPLELPCRYANKIACFTKVYIVSNISLLEQYTSHQHEHRETWEAFLRRIHKVIYWDEVGFQELTTNEYLKIYAD